MSNAKVISTKILGQVTKGSRTIQVGFVDKTDIWTRPFLSENIQQHFKQVTEGNIDSLRPDTAVVALQ